MTKDNNKKKKSKINFTKIMIVFMLVATIALYVSTIVYAVAVK